MDLIKRLFGNSKKAEPATALSTAGPPDSRPVEIHPQASARRELVRVVTRDALRSSGIPDSWLDLQILLELTRGQPSLHLRLVVKHWDPRLLKYAVAFQRKLSAEIEAIEPSSREWLLSIAWEYQVGNQCPFLEMPDFASWATPAAPPSSTEQAAPRDELQDDLDRLYAVRDANLAQRPPDPGASRADGPKKAPIIPDVLI